MKGTGAIVELYVIQEATDSNEFAVLDRKGTTVEAEDGRLDVWQGYLHARSEEAVKNALSRHLGHAVRYLGTVCLGILLLSVNFIQNLFAFQATARVTRFLGRVRAA
jgi:hypothetical protein